MWVLIHSQRSVNFFSPDVFSGPLSELEIWQRRQRVLLSVADQLKNKECKTVIGILITTKSRVLKKWKVVDAGSVELYS